ncbi:HNH endonuclease family protein [Streptomyces sp. NPDC051909]|uniref:HNH endonuclease family protein n=1 Tax=Streptomyces sp. NPDC051909 TaxID=3154944 RepID=UPI00342D418C
MSSHRKALAVAPVLALLALLALLVLLTGAACSPAPAPATAEPGSGSGSASGPVDGVSPLADPDGTRPGLAPLTTAEDRAAARERIGRLRTKGRGPRTGYAREAFGPAWSDAADGVPFARNGCDTRNDLLRRDGHRLRLRAGSDCVVVAMTLRDPYTGEDIDWRKADAAEVQLDHVIPLSYAWQLGAARWPEAQRRRFANDPLNLLPVSARTNTAKRDAGPAAWLPPHKPVRCAYALRFAQVALAYDLPVTLPDKSAMLRQCAA